MDNCFVFCSQSLEGVPPELAKALDGAFLIAVDGGLAHFSEMGLEPQLWVGDGDSLEDARRAKRVGKALTKAKFPRVRLPKSKNYSDLEYALHLAGQAWLEGDWSGDLVLLGAQGGRFDHDLGNMFAVQRWLHDMASATSGRECPGVYSYGPHGAWIASMSELRFKQGKGAVFSVFTLDRGLKLTISGARYTLRARPLDHGTLGLSNEGMGKVVTIKASERDVAAGMGPFFVVFPSGD